MDAHHSSPPWRLVAVLLFVVPLNQLPLDMYTPAMPIMEADLNAGAAALQYTVSVYLLGMSLGYLPVGILSDAHGRKPVLLSCIGLLVVTSLGCALADNIGVLLGLRLVQGAVSSAFIIVAVAIAADCFQGARLTSVNGMLGAAWASAPVLAPAAGGFIVEYLSWRVVFVVIAACSIMVGVLVVTMLPETLPVERRSPLSPGAIRSVGSETIRNPTFLALVAVFGLAAGSQLSFGVAAPFLYQNEMGFSPSSYGLVALAVGVAVLLGSLGTGILATRVSLRLIAFGAWTVFMAGALVILVSSVTIGVNVWALTAGGFLVVCGCGALCPQAQANAIGMFTRNLGLVGGMFGLLAFAIVAGTTMVVGVLPDRTPAPIGWLYVSCGVIVFCALVIATSRLRRGYLR